jgi:hypothetical protein
MNKPQRDAIDVTPANLTATRPLSSVERSTSGEFETAVSSGRMFNVISKTALKSGSSQQGNARRQSVDCI